MAIPVSSQVVTHTPSPILFSRTLYTLTEPGVRILVFEYAKLSESAMAERRIFS